MGVAMSKMPPYFGNLLLRTISFTWTLEFFPKFGHIPLLKKIDIKVLKLMRTQNINLKMKFTPQGKRSANCGPCSLKMISDHFKIKNPQGELYSVPSLNRLLNVSTKWGCEKSDMARVLRRLGLKRKKIKHHQIKTHLKKNRPVLTLIIDEEGGGHYTLIKGVKEDQFIFHDPYWGQNFKRSFDTLKKQTKFFDDWIWAIDGQVIS